MVDAPMSVMLPEPVIEVPGHNPKSPFIVVDPVLVTVEAPSTAKLCEEPRILAADSEDPQRANRTATRKYLSMTFPFLALIAKLSLRCKGFYCNWNRCLKYTLEHHISRKFTVTLAGREYRRYMRMSGKSDHIVDYFVEE